MIQVGNYIYIPDTNGGSIGVGCHMERKGNLYDLFYKKGGGRRCSI